MLNEPTTNISYFLESRPANTDGPWEQTGLRYSCHSRAKAEENLAAARKMHPAREHRLVTRTTTITEEPTR